MPSPASPATVTWLWERRMGRVGRLRAMRTAVLVDSPLLKPPSRMAESSSSNVAPRLRLVSVPILREGESVCMAVSASWSSVEIHTSTMSQPKGRLGGNMT